jgi:hypothetical protein
VPLPTSKNSEPPAPRINAFKSVMTLAQYDGASVMVVVVAVVIVGHLSD